MHEGPARSSRPPLIRAASTSADLLGDALGLQEKQQVVAAAGLGVGAAHVEAAERVGADDRAGGLAVDVEVADEELALGALDLLGIAGVDRAGEPVLGAVGDRQR